MDKNVQQTVHVEHTEMILPTNVNFVTTHAHVVQEVLMLIVPLVTMELTGMKENVHLFAQQDTGKMMMEILVTDVMEVASPVPEETNMIVNNHVQLVFTGMMDTVTLLAQMVLMKTMPPSQLVKIAT